MQVDRTSLELIELLFRVIIITTRDEIQHTHGCCTLLIVDLCLLLLFEDDLLVWTLDPATTFNFAILGGFRLLKDDQSAF